MVIYNGLVFTEEMTFEAADIFFEEGRIVNIAPPDKSARQNGIDADGGFVIPGLIDIHTHGAKGYDFSDADGDSLEILLRYYLKNGVTSVLGTSLAYPPNQLYDIVEVMQSYYKKEGYGAVLRGIHMEGPFLNGKRRGAQNLNYLQNPDYEIYKNMQHRAEGNVKIFTIAPEMPGAMELIKKARQNCFLSIGHTDADYATTAAAFKIGASHVTHLFNGMPPLLNRSPGVIGAAFDFANRVELICDGIHTHPSVVRATYQLFGAERVCLVSDSIRATGMPDGNYTLGEQSIHKQGPKSTLQNGTIAGSVSSLLECCQNALQFGVPLERVVQSATINPAKAGGMEDEVGSFAPGKRADILILNQQFQLQQIIQNGQPVAL